MDANALKERGASFIKHYGIKGMKWGVRRKRGPDGTVRGAHPPSQDAIDTVISRSKIGKGNDVSALSTKELQTVVTRMNLEQQYGSLVGKEKAAKRSAGAKFVSGLLQQEGQNQAKVVTNAVASKHVQDALNKKGYGKQKQK